MVIIAAAIFGICVILLVLSRREKAEEEWGASKVTLPFYKMAAYVYPVVKPRAAKYFTKLNVSLGRLYPGEKIYRKEKVFFVKKAALVFLLLTFGTAFLLCLELADRNQDDKIPENRLKRKDAAGSAYRVELSAGTQVYDNMDLELEVNQRRYTQEEFDAVIPEFTAHLEKAFLGDNESVDRIVSDVDLVDCVEGFPFQVEWKCSDWKVIDHNGKIADLEQKEIVELTAKILYEEFEDDYVFPVMVHPKELTEEERFWKELLKNFEASDEETKNEEFLILPEEVDGVRITWTKKKAGNMGVFLLMLLAGSIAVFIGQDKDLEKQVTKRNEQMLADYPEIVSKLTLYVGAGMPVRGALFCIGAKYRDSRKEDPKGEVRFAYEEIILSCLEMESGVEEVKAYRNFTARCQVQKYVKLGAMLEQNVRMGSRELLSNLDAEAKDAFEMRKSQAEKLGEQAGTKLMIPMFMMLIVVIVMIMVPAFMGM